MDTLELFACVLVVPLAVVSVIAIESRVDAQAWRKKHGDEFAQVLALQVRIGLLNSEIIELRKTISQTALPWSLSRIPAPGEIEDLITGWEYAAGGGPAPAADLNTVAALGYRLWHVAHPAAPKEAIKPFRMVGGDRGKV